MEKRKKYWSPQSKCKTVKSMSCKPNSYKRRKGNLFFLFSMHSQLLCFGLLLLENLLLLNLMLSINKRISWSKGTAFLTRSKTNWHSYQQQQKRTLALN